MRHLSRLLVFLIFFFPLVAALFYLFRATDHLDVHSGLFFAYWNEYVKQASLISFVVGMISIIFAIQIVFIVGFCLFSYRRKKLEKWLALFLGVPHLAFFTGVLFVISSSGLAARLFHHLSLYEFAGFDHDPWGLSLALSLGLKESLFLLFVMLPIIHHRKNHFELLVTQSFGHSEFSYWVHILWPNVLRALRYPIWMVIAFSISVVDLSIVLGPTNPPPFALVLWEFFRSPDPADLFKILLGSFHLVLILVLTISAWEILVHLYSKVIQMKISRNPNLNWMAPKKIILGVFFGLQTIPIFVLSLWAFADEWVFPDLLPTSFTMLNFKNGFEMILPTFLTSVSLGILSAGISTLICLVWFEWDELSLKNWVLFPIFFVPVFPILPLLFGLDIFLNSFFDLTSFAAVLCGHVFFVFPYVFLILKSHFVNFDMRFKQISLGFGRSVWFFFLKVRLPLLVSGIFTAISVGFAVSIAQYVSTLFFGGGRVETLTTQMVVAAAGENRKWMGVFGLIQIFLPAMMFLIAQSFGKEKK